LIEYFRLFSGSLSVQELWNMYFFKNAEETIGMHKVGRRLSDITVAFDAIFRGGSSKKGVSKFEHLHLTSLLFARGGSK